MDAIDNNYGFIYITTNIINGHKYIGKKAYDKYGKWKNYLGSGIALKKALNKYGKNNFIREIVDIAASEKQLCEKERYWIDYFNAVGDKSFYNMALGGNGGNTRAGYSKEKIKTFEEKRIKAVRESLPKGENTGSAKLTNADVISIIKRLKNDDFIKDIAIDYNVSVSTIHDIRKQKTWTHLTTGIEFTNITGRKRPGNVKSISQYDLSGNFIKTYLSARDADKKTGVSYKLISQACKGNRKTACGYVWKFSCDNNSV